MIITNQAELKTFNKSGEILSSVLRKCLAAAKPGVTTLELEKIAWENIEKAGAAPSFTFVKKYPFATCMCVNDIVVHGLPSHYKLKFGDILGIDCGVYWQKIHTDASWSIIIGEKPFPPEKENFLKVGEEALKLAIDQAVPGNRVWDISNAIFQRVEKQSKFHVVRVLTGHGVGHKLHEDPLIPGVPEGKRDKTPLLCEGMVLAIEVIFGEKTPKVWYKNNDGWSIATQDGSLSGLFEKTIVVAKKPVVLTQIFD